MISLHDCAYFSIDHEVFDLPRNKGYCVDFYNFNHKFVRKQVWEIEYSQTVREGGAWLFYPTDDPEEAESHTCLRNTPGIDMIHRFFENVHGLQHIEDSYIYSGLKLRRKRRLDIRLDK